MYILFLFFAVRKLVRFALIPHMLNLLGYGFLMSLVKSFLFMLLGGSYTVYYRRDYMPTGRRRIIAYCFIGAAVFSLLHFKNPRFSVSLAVCQMGLHFILGFELMAFLLRTKGIEVSWGISFAYTLLRSVLFADGEVSSPGALYTFNGNAGPMMIFLGIVFTVLSALIVSFLLERVLRKEACR
ncbi:MAG: hypothetical protein K6E89_01275, partial [Sphaerochaetaceae bacterium]|nr:hypothetical protein [Sphaerochaetaceae bacterium]